MNEVKREDNIVKPGADSKDSTKIGTIDNNGSQIAYTYDANGNIETITENGKTIKYTYNELNEVTREDNAVLNKTIVYNYDAGGNITSKIEYPYTTGSLGTATKTVNYGYGDSNWKDKLTSDSEGDLLSMNLNGSEYYYIRNAQGDIIGLFDKNGATVAYYTYDTWGKLISIKDGSGTDRTNNTSSVGYKNPYRYRGYRYDTETGLYYLNARYYNAEWGRFINADAAVGSIGELSSHNMFVYCLNNPVNMSDPSGNWPSWLHSIVNAVVSTISSVVSAVVNVVVEVETSIMNVVSKKDPPPKSVGYDPPKGKSKTQTAKAPNGQKGFLDSKGNVWVPIPEGHPLAHGGEHWDVNYPNGGYDNVYPNGIVRKGSGSRGIFSPQGKRIVIAGGGSILLYGAYRTARMLP